MVNIFHDLLATADAEKAVTLNNASDYQAISNCWAMDYRTNRLLDYRLELTDEWTRVRVRGPI